MRVAFLHFKHALLSCRRDPKCNRVVERLPCPGLQALRRASTARLGAEVLNSGTASARSVAVSCFMSMQCRN